MKHIYIHLITYLEFNNNYNICSLKNIFFIKIHFIDDELFFKYNICDSIIEFYKQ